MQTDVVQQAITAAHPVIASLRRRKLGARGSQTGKLTRWTMKSLVSSFKHPHSAFHWLAAIGAALVLLLVSLAAGAVGHYVLNWF
jgi:hypothetical protein